jgi:hypothetical protein
MKDYAAPRLYHPSAPVKFGNPGEDRRVLLPKQQ